jgi:heterodisulfide reductase subunit C
MIIKLRNIAVEEGFILDSHFGLASNIFYETGHGVPANDPEGHKQWRALRESYGLPPLPPTVHSYPEAVEECQTLMKEVGFRELLDNAAKLKAKRKAEAEKKAKEEAKEEEKK